MANNETSDPQLKPTHSSSSESESESDNDDQTHISGTEDDDGSSSASDSEPQQKQTLTLTPPPQSTNKPQHPSHSDHPTEESSKKTNLNSTKSAKRHASPSENQKDAKKAKKMKKKKKKKNDAEKKVKMFQRLWSEADEIVILNGLIDYKKQNNGTVVICADMNDFHLLIKNSLHVDVTTSQLVGKIRKLKNKYDKNARKEISGLDRSGLNPHSLECYELSKLIWGSHHVAGGSSKNEIGVSFVESKGSGIDIDRFVKYASSCNGDVVLVEELIKVGMELVQGSKREEYFKDMLKDLKKDELAVFLKRMNLFRALTKVVYEALQSS